MRLVLILVAINILYAGWEYLRPSDTGSQPPPMDSRLARLQLLHEREAGGGLRAEAGDTGGDLSMVAEQLASPTQPQTQSEQVKQMCYTLGPFKDRKIMQRVSESMAEQVDDISLRTLQQSEKHRYWVHIPAAENITAAKQLATQLRAKDFRDFYIVLRGDAKNSISLGHFKEPEHASRRLKKVADMGFKADMEIIYREYDVYWLDYRIAGDEDVAVADNYLAEGVSRITRPCVTATE
ncbi:MAG TPA: SPOR domain-containing protein [Gammaproteobacteria bacterium]